MIKKVIFFITYPLNPHDYKRFGAEVISKNGFELFFFDFSDYMFPSLRKKINIASTDYSGHYSFANEEEAVRAILDLSKDCFVICLPPYSYKNFRIYQALSRKKIPYAIDIANAIPLPDAEVNSFQDVKINNVVNFFRRLSRLTLPKLRRFILNYLFQPRFYKYWRISTPRLCLAGGTASFNFYWVKRLYPFSKDTKVLWTHTLDYNIYLENRTNGSESSQNRAVFLDTAVPQFVGDDITMGKEPTVTKEKYYPSLCRFFDRVEKEQGVRVVIAGHPRANHGTYPDYFGRRLTEHGRTFQMIRDSRFIITHGSTAVNFAVLLKKPIVFITTDEYENSIYGDNFKVMSSVFGKMPINIDTEFSSDWAKELSVDEAIYADYKERYIKKRGTAELNSWQIFSDWLKKPIKIKEGY